MGIGEGGTMVTRRQVVDPRRPARMVASLQSRVAADAHGQPLLAWLCARFAYLDEAGWRAALASGAVRRNGSLARGTDVLATGDHIVFTPPVAATGEPDVPALHADADLVVVDKPAGLVVQHTSTWPGRTFLRRLAERWPPTAGARQLEPVHRLDRSTSGVLLIARHGAAAARWTTAFASGAIAKTYLALVQGVPANDAWTIDAPIGPAEGVVRARQAVRAAGDPAGRPAVTDVVVAERLPGHALVRLLPRTGRTHQLRVHLAHAGHPLVGDPLYGRTDDEFLAWIAQRRAEAPAPAGEPARTMLHAASLAGLGASWSVPPPADFVATLDALRRG